MIEIMLVGMGGLIGAVLRYILNGYIKNLTSGSEFPFGTLTVNVCGCMAIGIFSRWDELKSIFSPEIRLLIFMGILGAFTTFSTFGNETVQLINDRKLDFALLNVLSQLFLGIFAILAGRFLTSFFLK